MIDPAQVLIDEPVLVFSTVNSEIFYSRASCQRKDGAHLFPQLQIRIIVAKPRPIIPDTLLGIFVIESLIPKAEEIDGIIRRFHTRMQQQIQRSYRMDRLEI